MRALWLTTFAAIAACSADSPRVSLVAQATVYDEDDRLDVYEASASRARLAREAAVALIGPSQLRDQGDGTYRVEAMSLQQAFSLCDSERFLDQPAAASCSGVLIGDDLVATSAHCLPSDVPSEVDASSCGPNRYVFGFYVAALGQPIAIAHDDVYDCAEVVTRLVSGVEDRCQWDLAVVRLDRAVSRGRRPVQMRATPATPGEPLTVIGFPLGLPAKVDSGARVLEARAESSDYFSLNSDTFANSSGSGIFDEDGNLLGLLARGGRDFDDAGTCMRTHVADPADSSEYEVATKTAALESALRARLHGESLAACGDSAACDLEDCPEQRSANCSVLRVGSRAPAPRSDYARGLMARVSRAWQRVFAPSENR